MQEFILGMEMKGEKLSSSVCPAARAGTGGISVAGRVARRYISVFTTCKSSASPK